MESRLVFIADGCSRHDDPAPPRDGSGKKIVGKISACRGRFISINAFIGLLIADCHAFK
jgi:hypothetical protein